MGKMHHLKMLLPIIYGAVVNAHHLVLVHISGSYLLIVNISYGVGLKCVVILLFTLLVLYSIFFMASSMLSISTGVFLCSFSMSDFTAEIISIIIIIVLIARNHYFT